MQKTFVRFVKYRGELFTDRTFKSEWTNFSMFSLKKFDFFYVETATNDTPYKLRHWYIAGFTQNKRRKIQMTFSAVAYTEEERRNLIKLVNKIFEPPYNPDFTDNRWFYPMEFTTIDGLVREFDAKVISRPEPKEDGGELTMEFDVELIVKDWSCMYWKELDLMVERNYVAWVSLEHELPLSFSSYPAPLINYSGISPALVKAQITALQDNATTGSIQIMSLRPTNYSRMYFNVDLDLWDVLIVDPQNYLVTLNGADITGTLELAFWNNFPVLIPDENPQQLVVDTGKPNQTVEVIREWRDTRC